VRVKTISLDEAVYKMNSRGPRTNPCGTPNRTIFCVDRAEPCRMHSTLFDRYDWSQSSAAALILKETLSRVSRMSWSTVSNAADRSSKARTDRSPSPTAYRMSVSADVAFLQFLFHLRHPDLHACFHHIHLLSYKLCHVDYTSASQVAQ